MCKQCQTKPVYEFTNQRKLCGRCFVNYFQKKVLYTIRKFGMIKNGDVVGYFPSNHFRGVVLEDILKIFAEKANVELRKLPAHFRSQIDYSEPDICQGSSLKKFVKQIMNLAENPDIVGFGAINNRAQRGQIKMALPFTLDSESEGIIQTLIQGREKSLEKFKPVSEKIIKPLYLFSDEEVLLYAKLRKLKFRKTENRKDKISEFLDDIEKKHPEVKRAIVNGYLGLR